MIGTVTVMQPRIKRGSPAATTGSAGTNGERLFSEPRAPATSRTPQAAVHGSAASRQRSRSTTAARVVADENYLRESSHEPQAKVVQGFQPIMPTFQGQVSEENLLQLIAYVKTLKPADPAAAKK